MADIIYTTVDEAPELASASLLPIIKKFASAAGLQIETRDISLASRIIAMFPEILTEEQRHGDDLGINGVPPSPQSLRCLAWPFRYFSTISPDLRRRVCQKICV